MVLGGQEGGAVDREPELQGADQVRVAEPDQGRELVAEAAGLLRAAALEQLEHHLPTVSRDVLSQVGDGCLTFAQAANDLVACVDQDKPTPAPE